MLLYSRPHASGVLVGWLRIPDQGFAVESRPEKSLGHPSELGISLNQGSDRFALKLLAILLGTVYINRGGLLGIELSSIYI